jgi:amino acid transporter
MPNLQRRLSLFSLVMAVVTSTIGSGWLFAPYISARLAAGGSLLSWLLGGGMSFLIALVFAELGALVSTSGALAQIPLLTHGRAAGFLGGWAAWLGYVALPAIEVLATVQYLGSSLPWLTNDGGAGQVLSGWGIALASLLLVLFGWINLAGVAVLARWIEGLTIWKLVVPVTVSLVLIAKSGHWGNLATGGGQGGGVLEALGTGGILFSLLGFRTAVDLAGEARRPQRDVPLSMALGLGISLAIYLVLQLAFLVAVPPSELQQGWQALRLTSHGGPLVALALGLGFGGLATLLLTDAVISPSGTAMTYMATAARLNWMLSRCRLLPSAFSHINRAGVPSVALIASLLIGLVLLLGGPSWQKAVGFVTAAMVISLAVGPVSLQALRRQAPHLDRPYRLPWASLLCPLTFVLASWAILWCGWSSLRLAVPLVLVPALLFLIIHRGRDAEIGGALWWFLYLAGLSLISWLGTSSARPLLSPSQQLVVAAMFALAVFPLAVHSRLLLPSPHAMLNQVIPDVPTKQWTGQ